MNPIKLITPDFFLGRSLVAIKMIYDIFTVLLKNPSVRSLKVAKLILKVKPKFTMVKSKNLLNLYALTQRANDMNLDGDIVECGVWNGGSAALMAFATKNYEKPRNRLVWLFDSFGGLPRPGPNDGAAENQYYFEGLNRGSVQHVVEVFAKLGISMDHVRIHSGWFESTLREADLERIAVLHIDADWYDSVKLVLDAFYDKVVPGGFVVLDDYGYWEGCKRALDDFLSQNNIDGIKLMQVDSTGAHFQKPAEIEKQTHIA
jgi:O-methyltransferase